jgi:hypothetical protein
MKTQKLSINDMAKFRMKVNEMLPVGLSKEQWILETIKAIESAGITNSTDRELSENSYNEYLLKKKTQEQERINRTLAGIHNETLPQNASEKWCNEFAKFLNIFCDNAANAKMVYSWLKQIRTNKVQNRIALHLASEEGATGKSMFIKTLLNFFKNIGLTVSEGDYPNLAGRVYSSDMAQLNSVIGILECRDWKAFEDVDLTKLIKTIENEVLVTREAYGKPFGARSITNIISAGNELPDWMDRRILIASIVEKDYRDYKHPDFDLKFIWDNFPMDYDFSGEFKNFCNKYSDKIDDDIEKLIIIMNETGLSNVSRLHTDWTNTHNKMAFSTFKKIVKTGINQGFFNLVNPEETHWPRRDITVIKNPIFNNNQ